MIHPLLGHLKDSSEEELTKNISKLTQALYSVRNEYLIQQIHLALDDLKEALQQKIKKDPIVNNNDVDNLININ